jgi:histidine ammonia-lyase
MTRAETLDKAKQCVCVQRENEYGSPEDNFKIIADLWAVYRGVEFTANDVAMMMALLKIARIKTGTASEDSFMDLAGYAACGAEIATNNIKKGE